MGILPILITSAILQMISAHRLYELLPTEEQHLSSCLNTIIRRHFTPRGALLISLPNTGYDVTNRNITTILPKSDNSFMTDILLETIHTESQRSIYVSGPKLYPETFHDEGYNYDYVILTREPREHGNLTDTLSRQLQKLHPARPLHHRALFLIALCSSSDKLPEDLALTIVEDIWATYNITDVLLLIKHVNKTKSDLDIFNGAQETKGKAFHLYKWQPYSSVGNCVNVNSLTLVGTWLVKTNRHLSYDGNLSANRLSGDSIRCTLKVGLLPFPATVTQLPGRTNKQYYALELNILTNILEKLNLSAEFRVLLPTNKSRVAFGTDTVSETANAGVDISFGGLVISEKYKSRVDFTVSYAETAVKWYVPCAENAHCFEAAFRMFSLGVWASLCCVGLLVAILMRVMATRVNTQRIRESYTYMTLQSSAYTLWATYVGVGVPHLPRTSSLRILFSTVLCYSFALTTIFQSYFTSFWINPRSEIKISSVKDILDRGFAYGYTSDTEDYLDGIDESEYQTIREHRIKCKDKKQCFNRVMQYGDFACIADTFSVAVLMDSRTAKGKVCAISTDVARLKSVMYLKKGHPLLSRFNKIIRRLIEGGFEKTWGNNLYLENTPTTMLSFYYDNDTLDYNEDAGDTSYLESGYFVLSVKHLKTEFYLFLLGCALSCVVFVAEMLYHV
jgi:hypothetical protein